MLRGLLACALVCLVPARALAEDDGTARGLVVNGAIATTLGAAALIAGGALYWQAERSWDRPGGCGGSCTDSTIVAGSASMGLLAAGAIHVAVGVPLLAAGLHRRSRPGSVQVGASLAPFRHGAAGMMTVLF